MNVKVAAAAAVLLLAGCGGPAVTAAAGRAETPEPAACPVLLSAWQDAVATAGEARFTGALNALGAASSLMATVTGDGETPSLAEDEAFARDAGAVDAAAGALISAPPPACTGQFRADYVAAMREVQKAAVAGSLLAGFLEAGDGTAAGAAARVFAADLVSAENMLAKTESEE